MYFLADIGLMKNYVADAAHMWPLYRANYGFVPAPIKAQFMGNIEKSQTHVMV